MVTRTREITAVEGTNNVLISVIETQGTEGTDGYQLNETVRVEDVNILMEEFVSVRNNLTENIGYMQAELDNVKAKITELQTIIDGV